MNTYPYHCLLASLLLVACYDGELSPGPSPGSLSVAACNVSRPPDGRTETTCLIGRSGSGYRVTLAGQSYTSGTADDARSWCCSNGATQEQATDDTECLGANPCPGLQYSGESYCLSAGGSKCLCGLQAEVDAVWRYLATTRVSSCPVPSSVPTGQAYCCDTFSGLCVCNVRPGDECGDVARSFPEHYRTSCP